MREGGDERTALLVDEDAARLDEAEHVGAVTGGAGRVDRRGDGADPGESEIDERPFEPCRSHDPDDVPFLDPEREEPECDVLDAARRFVP